MSEWNKHIDALREQKLVFNEEKLKLTDGFYNIDDHGWVPLEFLHELEVFTDEKSGLCTGMDAVSRTFVSFIDSHPPYVNPDSACAGGWLRFFPIPATNWRPEECWQEHEDILVKYNVITRGIYGLNHSGPDLRIGLDLGWGGLLEKVQHFRKLNTEASHEFYDGEERVIKALQRLISRTAVFARELASKEPDAWKKQNLIEIAGINEYLVNGVPRTLREAVQWMVWYEAVDRMYYGGGDTDQPIPSLENCRGTQRW